jgi:hypothetical protein
MNRWSRFELYRNRAKLWFWRERDFYNGKIIDGSTQGYRRRYSAVQNLRRAKSASFPEFRKPGVSELVLAI